MLCGLGSLDRAEARCPLASRARAGPRRCKKVQSKLLDSPTFRECLDMAPLSSESHPLTLRAVCVIAWKASEWSFCTASCLPEAAP